MKDSVVLINPISSKFYSFCCISNYLPKLKIVYCSKIGAGNNEVQK
jgi:hypothetical protein